MHCDRRQEGPFVFKVTVGSVRGHANLARDLAQTEGFCTDLLNQTQASFDQRISEVAVVICLFRVRHVLILAA